MAEQRTLNPQVRGSSPRRRTRSDRDIAAGQWIVPDWIASRQVPAVRASRGRAISARKRALRQQADAGLPEHCDRDWYRRAVLPLLAGHRLSEITAAANCSKGYASTIRKGTYVPHVSTWTALAELAGVEMTERATG